MTLITIFTRMTLRWKASFEVKPCIFYELLSPDLLLHLPAFPQRKCRFDNIQSILLWLDWLQPALPQDLKNYDYLLYWKGIFGDWGRGWRPFSLFTNLPKCFGQTNNGHLYLELEGGWDFTPALFGSIPCCDQRLHPPPATFNVFYCSIK